MKIQIFGIICLFVITMTAIYHNDTFLKLRNNFFSLPLSRFAIENSTESDQPDIQKGANLVLFKAFKHLSAAFYSARSSETIMELTKLNKELAKLSELLLKSPEITKPSPKLTNRFLEQSQRSPSEKTASAFVCPEKWNCAGQVECSWANRTYYRNCTGVKRLGYEHLITFLMFVPFEIQPENVWLLIQGIKSSMYKKVNVVIVGQNYSAELTEETITKICIEKNFTLMNMLSAGLERVNTKYVVLLRKLTNFDKTMDIDRLIENLDVANITTGSMRQENGHWTLGCQRMKVRNSTIEVSEGYDLSFKSCVYCDYIHGTFIADKSFLQQNLGPNTLNGESFFTNLWYSSQDKATVLNCPDVMFEVDNIDIAIGQPSEWIPFAKHHQISIFKFPNGKFEFTCAEINIECVWEKAGYLLPACCYKILANQLRDTVEELDKLNIQYEMSSGSAMGAVKFAATLPWEIDHDCMVLSHNMTLIDEQFTEKFKNLGYATANGLAQLINCTSKSHSNQTVHCGEYYVNKGPFRIELWGLTQLERHFYKQKFKNPTRIKMNGYWTAMKPNPALIARNRYGDDIFRHIEHWRALKAPPGRLYQLVLNEGFRKCETPGFHRCLDENYLPYGDLHMRF